jgi:hypothetical protein
MNRATGFAYPLSAVCDQFGNVYVSEWFLQRIDKLTPTNGGTSASVNTAYTSSAVLSHVGGMSYDTTFTYLYGCQTNGNIARIITSTATPIVDAAWVFLGVPALDCGVAVDSTYLYSTFYSTTGGVQMRKVLLSSPIGTQ